MKSLHFAIVALMIGGCASGPSLGKVTDIVIEESGNSTPDDPQARCEGFHLSPRQVEQFLNHAAIVAGHHHFRWSPCYLEGSAMIDDVPAFWVIRKYGIGYIKYFDIDYDLASEEALQLRDQRMSVD
jgi:hypothetical protein